MKVTGIFVLFSLSAISANACIACAVKGLYTPISMSLGATATAVSTMIKEDNFSWQKFVTMFKKTAKWEDDDPNKEAPDKKRKKNPHDNRLDHDYGENPE